jgi:hypothetical protein
MVYKLCNIRNTEVYYRLEEHNKMVFTIDGKCWYYNVSELVANLE